MSTEDRSRQNRERFPKVAATIVDPVEAVFGKVRVIWCEENGQRAGNRNG
jgi:hypothetical protein